MKIGMNKDKCLAILNSSNNTSEMKKALTSLFLNDCGLRVTKDNENEIDDHCLNQEQLKWKKSVAKFGFKVTKI